MSSLVQIAIIFLYEGDKCQTVIPISVLQQIIIKVMDKLLNNCTTVGASFTFLVLPFFIHCTPKVHALLYVCIYCEVAVILQFPLVGSIKVIISYQSPHTPLSCCNLFSYTTRSCRSQNFRSSKHWYCNELNTFCNYIQYIYKYSINYLQIQSKLQREAYVTLNARSSSPSKKQSMSFQLNEAIFLQTSRGPLGRSATS